MRLRVLAPFVALAVALGGCGGDEPDRTSSGASTGGPLGESNVLQIAGGRYHTCALLRDGSIFCWGQGAYRQLGGDYGHQGTARRVDTVADATAIECGHRFTCAIRPGGAVWCWGDDDHGQAGTAETVPCGDAAIDSVCVTTPQPVVGLESGVVELALGEDHACVRMSDGSVRCWGDNAKGQVGSSALGDIASPTPVAGVSGAVQVVAGDAHTCALVGSPGTVSCWGANGNAQVGNGDTNDAVTSPATVAGLADAVEIIAGGEHTCARRAGGGVVCWGYDYLGQLGNGSKKPTRATSPQTVVDLADAAQLAAGRYHTCARRADATIACWGLNAKGEVGDGTTTDRTSPTPVGGLGPATFVASGAWHTCAAIGAGEIWCWGDDLGSQLGDDRVVGAATPNPVAAIGLP